MNEFESRKITVGEYLRARDLMVRERNSVWERYEAGHFQSEELAELIDAYDLVVDSMTCLAMERSKAV